MRYYVYALIDPKSDTPFYIGKGTKNRIEQHFKDLDRLCLKDSEDDYFVNIIADSIIADLKGEIEESPKSAKIRELLNEGYSFNDIGRIIAKDLDEITAFTIESFVIKFVYGIENLTNRIEGEHSERFRPCDNWSCLPGFDTPVSNKKNSSSGDKTEILKRLLDIGVDKPLLKIKQAFPELLFSPLRTDNAQKLEMKADVKKTKIRVFIKKQNIQIELRGGSKWLRNHFVSLGCENLVRKGKEAVFLPKLWKNPNMASNSDIAIERIKLLLEIVYANGIDDISDEAKKLLF